MFFKLSAALRVWSRWVNHGSLIAVAVLTLAMIYEVAARYVFDAPTLWAFDIAYMANGSIFILAAAFTLDQDGHIRIDVLSSRFGERTNRRIKQVTYLVFLIPIFAGLSYAALHRVTHALRIGEVDTVSPWKPLMWPFYLIIFVGVVTFLLQLIAEFIDTFRKEGE